MPDNGFIVHSLTCDCNQCETTRALLGVDSVRTTEDATQTGRAGERGCETGLWPIDK